MSNCLARPNIAQKMTQLCFKIKSLENRFIANDYGNVANILSDDPFAGFQIGLQTLGNLIFDSNNINLINNDTELQVNSAGVYQVNLSWNTRTDSRPFNPITENFIYQIETNPALPVPIYGCVFSGGDATSITPTSIAPSLNNENTFLVRLPAGGTISVNVLTDDNTTTNALPIFIPPSNIPMISTLSIIKIA